MKISISLDCIECEEENYIEDINFTCEECLKKTSNLAVKEAIEHSYNNKPWESKSFEFNSDEEKKHFLMGVKFGVEDALFWVADYYDESQFLEKLIQKKDKEITGNPTE